MNKIIIKILIGISIFIIAFGIIIAKNTINSGIKDGNTTTENIYIDGSDVTHIATGFEEIGTVFLGVVMVIYSFFTVACIWVIYGIILLIIMIVKKCKSIRNVEKDVKVKRGED